MIVAISEFLDAQALGECRDLMAQAEWTDAGDAPDLRSLAADRAHRLPDGSLAAERIGRIVADALGRSDLFIAAALPAQILPPAIVSHGPGPAVGPFVDDYRKVGALGDLRIRGDLSAVVFLSDPADYDGGDLVVEDTYGPHAMKRAAGDLVIFSAASLIRIDAITRGERRTAVFAVQSTIRDSEARSLLFDLDSAVQALPDDAATYAEITRLTGIYHNLMRRWAEA